MRQVLVLMAGLFTAFAAHGALPGRDWWYASPEDGGWTNKPLIDIEAAAGRNDPVAQYYFGYASFLGRGGERDMSQSFLWIRRSAEQGYAQAQLLTARFFFLGLGTSRDPTEAIRWVSRAADQGHAEAMVLLGRAHEYGDGTPRDAKKALEWLQRAEAAGSRNAPKWLGDFYIKGEARTARRTNYVEALHCYERAASNGIASAAMQAAMMYERGLGTPQNFQVALHWARLFSDKGDPDALEKLTDFYAAGLAEPRGPYDMPISLRRKAAVLRAITFEENGERSNPLNDDCRDLWNRYRFGIGTSRDYVASAEWMWVSCLEDYRRVAAGRRATDETLAPGPFEPVLKGKVPALTADERLWQQAVRLVHEALDEGRGEAWYRIGESYRDGSSLTPIRPLFAWGWFVRAAELGHAPARDALKALEAKFTADELVKAKAFWVPPLPKR